MSEKIVDRPHAENIEQLVEQMECMDYPADHVLLLKKAYAFSEKAHSGQIRRSGEPYISHPVGVSSVLVSLNLDVYTIMTGLLHDTVEDTDVTLDDIEANFGEVVRYLVDGVTKITQMKFRHTHEKQGENIRKMIVAMGKDIRVIMVKLADRLHNMRTLNHMPFEKQESIARETLDIYCPLASRLGMSSVKIELEDLSFRYSNPERFYELVQKVDKKKKDREKYIDEVKDMLFDEITKRTKFEFEVTGRPKHLYSIFKKMDARNVEYEQVYDLLAFRVCVNSISECYEVLGIIHSLFKPIPGRFKDFIAMAKANNYQSLHTTVVGPQGERLEIQIRTFEMHQIAERGIAAHWKYKDAKHGRADTGEETLNQFNWLRELVSLHQQTNSSDEFLENIKTDLVESEVYVFTPKGEVKEFPDGATPIDFAFSVHTDVGSQIVAARINGKMVSLKHRLRNGDRVEVITSKSQTPSKDWLKFCVTSKAKTKIRSFVKAEQRERALNLGKEIIEKAFRKKGISIKRAFSGPEYDKYIKAQGYHTMEDLFINVGYGKHTPDQILASLELLDKKIEEEGQPVTNEGFLQKALKTVVPKPKKKNDSLILVGGMSDMLVRYGKCCTPIPGDPIIGFITRGHGATIHRADCDRAFSMDQARRIEVEWGNKGAAGQERTVKLRVICQDIPGLLKSMTDTFSVHGVNIFNAQIKTTRDHKAVCHFDGTVRNTSHLFEVIHALKKIKGVLSVVRA